LFSYFLWDTSDVQRHLRVPYLWLFLTKRLDESSLASRPVLPVEVLPVISDLLDLIELAFLDQENFYHIA